MQISFPKLRRPTTTSIIVPMAMVLGCVALVSGAIYLSTGKVLIPWLAIVGGAIGVVAAAVGISVREQPGWFVAIIVLLMFLLAIATHFLHVPT